jgi:hypothetical protein
MTIEGVKRLFQEAHEMIETRKLWKSYCKLIEKEEGKMWNVDNITENVVDRVVINVDSDTDTDIDSDSSMSETESNEEVVPENVPQASSSCISDNSTVTYDKLSEEYTLCRSCGEPERIGDNVSNKPVWVGCDICEQWYHTVCLDENSKSKALDSIQENTQWHCPDCVQTNLALQSVVCSVCSSARNDVRVICSSCNICFHIKCLPKELESIVLQMIDSVKGMKSLGLKLPMKWLCPKCSVVNEM